MYNHTIQDNPTKARIYQNEMKIDEQIVDDDETMRRSEVLEARVSDLTAGLKEAMVLFKEREDSFDSLATINLQQEKKVIARHLCITFTTL